MNQDATFRPVLVVGFLAVVLSTLYHRLRSWASGEKLDRRQEGLFILATLRPDTLMLWLGVIAYLVNPAWMAWSSVPLPAWLRWTGVGVCAIATGLLTWTLHSPRTSSRPPCRRRLPAPRPTSRSRAGSEWRCSCQRDRCQEHRWKVSLRRK